MELVDSRKAPKSGMPTEGIGVLVGYPKTGKTTLAASFPGSYVLELEKFGADRVDGRVHEIKNLGEFRQILPLLVKEPSVKTIVIDTLDVVSDWLEDEVAQERGLESITERKQGVDGFELWGTFKKRMEKLALYLKNCGKLVILIAHTKEAKQDSSGAVITPAGINVPGKSGAFIAAQADLIGFCYKKRLGAGTQFFVTFQGGPLGQWGSRIAEVNDKTITLPAENPYKGFAAAFVVNGKKPAPVVVKKNGKKSKKGGAK